MVLVFLCTHVQLQIPSEEFASQVTTQERTNSIDPCSLKYVGLALQDHRNDLHSYGDARIQTTSAPDGVVSTDVECSGDTGPSGEGVRGNLQEFVGNDEDEEDKHQSANTFSNQIANKEFRILQ